VKTLAKRFVQIVGVLFLVLVIAAIINPPEKEETSADKTSREPNEVDYAFARNCSPPPLGSSDYRVAERCRGS